MDIEMSDGYVVHTGKADYRGKVIDCKDCYVIPAGVDMHVHMRDGEQAYKETWQTGTDSAIAGGVTVVVDQPNTIPPLVNSKVIMDRISLAGEQSLCRYGVNGAVSPGSDIPGLWEAGCLAFGETFVGPSSYGEAVSLDLLAYSMDRISDLQGIMTVHAEEVLPGNDTSLKIHDILRPASGEVDTVKKIQQMNKSRCQLHFCHLSSADALKSVMEGTKEVTPHHLFLSREMDWDEEQYGKVNPPLRTEAERKKLVSCWNYIDLIASDHAPHAPKEKLQPFDRAPSGIPGVETMIPLLMGWVLEHRISLEDLIQKTSSNPAKILGIKPAGYTPGSRADFAIYPKVIKKIDIDSLHSKAGWTPYDGMKAVFPEKVILEGEIVYDSGSFFLPSIVYNEKRGSERTGFFNPPKTWIAGRGYAVRDEI